MIQPRDACPNPPVELIAPDCRHYLGDRPCVANRLCRGCDQYSPYRERIAIIKLGALGDVIRTLCILPELRRRHPHAQITWITRPSGRRMIEGHPDIDRVIEFDPIQNAALTQEAFDLLISLDKEPEPCGLAMALRAGQRLGVGLSPWGKPVPFNPEAVDYFCLGLSDELKFHQNRASYPELVYGALGWSYAGQRYELPISPERSTAMRDLLRARGASSGRRTVGINVGAGRVFANKMWPAAKTARLIQTLLADPGAQVVLLGGPDEADAVREIITAVGSVEGASRVINPGVEHVEPDFVALVDACDALFSGDTMAMHVAIARQVPVVVLFGPTCEQEISLFGRGEKLVANVPCGPCYRRTCPERDVCLDAVSITQAAEAIRRALGVAATSQAASVSLPLPVLKPDVPRRQAG